jgi:oligoendopeptidase F
MTTVPFAPSPRWDLETLYAGVAGGAAIGALVEETEATLRRLLDAFRELPLLGTAEDAAERWAEALLTLERTDDALTECWCLGECALSADVDDTAAKKLVARASDLSTIRGQISVPIWSKLAEASDAAFAAFLKRDDVSHMQLDLVETRDLAKISMPHELEALHAELSRDGFHSWSRLYDSVSDALRVTVDRGDGPEALSVEQAKNLLESRDRALRQHVAQALHTAWDGQKDVFAAALNHINGYRHTLYRRRGIDELEIPLRDNRLSRATLETMLGVMADFRPHLRRYLDAKARLLGLDQLSWFDTEVAVGEEGGEITYADAQRFIVSEFGAFSGRLGEFARKAFSARWIEAEDRAGKRNGGFCCGFPVRQQSRIFMTYGDTPGSLQTLAHELGHAYHSEVMWDLPGWQRDYPSTLAETASTFAESVVREAAFHQASDESVRLGMLDRKLTDAVGFLMNIPARFHFERAMYAERALGELPPERLSELVVAHFDTAYASGLEAYEQLFWASKGHFYITSGPFYNFPYSFGYLFSLGLFARALADGPSFAKAYDETLRLTGSHTCEDVAHKALGVDLTQPAFWESAVGIVARDVDTFIEMARESETTR